MNLGDVIACIDAKQAEHAADALDTPTGQTEWHYGLAVGVRAGLTMAKQAIEKMHEDDEERRNNL